MAELTRDDIRQAVRDELTNELHAISQAVARIDQRTNDLDETQNQIQFLTQELQTLLPQVQNIARGGQGGIDPNDFQDTKLRVQNIERGIAQIVQFLRAQSAASGDNNFRP